MRKCFFTFSLFIILLNLNSQVYIQSNDTSRYLKGSDAQLLTEWWVVPTFDDSDWESGIVPFRHGYGSDGTELLDMTGNYNSICLRKQFICSNIDSIKKVLFSVRSNGGYVIWVNGTKIYSYNIPEGYNYNSNSLFSANPDKTRSLIFDANDIPIAEGNNLVSVLVINNDLYNSYFYFDLKLKDYSNISEIDTDAVFSHHSGYYNNPFDLTVSVPDSSYNLIYTLDGSQPDSASEHSFVTKSATIKIDPDSTTGGRGITPAFIVKAVLAKNGYETSPVHSKTYIFSEKVKKQKYPGEEWPIDWINSQKLDYDMDSNVVNDSRYKNSMDMALKDLPVLSISTDLGNLFDDSYGIYVNAGGRGIEWERECNVELITKDTTEGFSINAGLRIRGASSRNGSNPKHSLRLFFRKEYGAGKLKYSLFGDEGAKKYDKLDLRTAQNYSWNSDSENGDHNTFVRDVFTRDSQRALGQSYTRSRFYHLYLNGMYWGIYQSQERGEARYAETYFGDDKDDYDVIKTDPVHFPYVIEVTDGNDQAWKSIYDYVQKDIKSNVEYYALEGKDAFGKPSSSEDVWVDIDNMIDYLITIFYTGNYDAPTSAFWGNRMPNNYYAIFNRKNAGRGFIFLAHDSEHSMMTQPIYVGAGLYEDRINIIDHPDDWFKMDVTEFKNFHPQWIHQKLCANDEYRLRFADRAYRLLSDEGVFSSKKVTERLNQRIGEIYNAIIAESARWGDVWYYPAKTKDDNWLPEITDLLGHYVPPRTDIVIDQLKLAGLYLELDAPVITKDDKPFNVWEYEAENPITIKLTNENVSGYICYTLDGTDPRELGGGISKTVEVPVEEKKFTFNGTAVLKARVKMGTQWSAMRELIIMAKKEDYSNLKITELHYHPLDEIVGGSDTLDDKNFEFIELKNTGDQPINISGIIVDSAIYYKVPEHTILNPGAFYVIASKPEYFYQRYGINPDGNYSGQLANSGEMVVVFAPDSSIIFDFEYDDFDPWPESADGNGFSLVSKDIMPVGDPYNYDYWRISYHINGSPFADDVEVIVPELAELCSNVYPNPTSGIIYIDINQILTDNNVLLEVYNQHGALCYKMNIYESENIIDLGNIVNKQGLYLLKLTSGKYAITNKVLFMK